MQEEIKEIRTVRITRKGQISIPAAVRAGAGFKEGAQINIIAYNNRVELRPMKKGKFTDCNSTLKQNIQNLVQEF